MDLLHIIVLSFIQGITEFLPISSSGHLILPHGLFGWPEQGLTFDVAVHVGTLIAVITYYRQDIIAIITDWSGSLVGKGHTDNSRLAWYIAAATVPAGLAGLAFDSYIEENLRSTLIIASTTIIFGILLAFADQKGDSNTKELTAMTLKIAIIIGCFQAVALIPGTSRSGITITAALFFYFSREASAKFSFLLSIPIILLSGGYKTLQLLDESVVNWFDLGLGVVLSAISAFICIHYFIKYINKIGMMPFVYYRIALGVFLFMYYAAGFFSI